MPDNRPAITTDENGEKMAPTGRYVVIKSEAAKQIFNINEDMLEPGKKLSIDTKLFDEITACLKNDK